MFTKTSKNSDHESVETEAKVDKKLLTETGPSKSAKVPRTDDQRTRSASYIGPTLHIKGEITIDESLSIEGIVEGTITSEANKLTVGKQGRVNADIHGSIVEVRGKIDGDIHGNDIVHLYSTAVVAGTIHCKKIVMDDGAVFNGRIDMLQDNIEPAKHKLALASDKKILAKIAS